MGRFYGLKAVTTGFVTGMEDRVAMEYAADIDAGGISPTVPFQTMKRFRYLGGLL